MPMKNRIKVCAQCGQTGRNADKIPHHTSEVNYVRMVLHCALVVQCCDVICERPLTAINQLLCRFYQFKSRSQRIFAKFHGVWRRLLVKWKLTYACLLLLPADRVDDAVRGVPSVQQVAVRPVSQRHAATARHHQHHLGPGRLAHYTLLEVLNFDIRYYCDEYAILR